MSTKLAHVSKLTWWQWVRDQILLLSFWYVVAEGDAEHYDDSEVKIVRIRVMRRLSAIITLGIPSAFWFYGGPSFLGMFFIALALYYLCGAMYIYIVRTLQ